MTILLSSTECAKADNPTITPNRQQPYYPKRLEYDGNQALTKRISATEMYHMFKYNTLLFPR